MTIHHATAAKAAKLEIVLTELDDGTVTFETEGTTSSGYPSGKEALEAAIHYQQDPEAVDDDAAEAQDDDEDEPSGTIVKRRYRDEYKARGDASTCGDDLAYAMKDFVTTQNEKGKDEMSLAFLAQLALDNDLADRLTTKWAHLNPGQKRMNLGNMLRSRFMKGDAVTIGNETHQLTEEQLEDSVNAA